MDRYIIDIWLSKSEKLTTLMVLAASASAARRIARAEARKLYGLEPQQHFYVLSR